MRLRLETSPSPVPVRRRATDGETLTIHWLGQAGFLLEADGLRVMIDPYLSDSLAGKYRGSELPHLRMAPPPVAPGELEEIDLLFSTHGHTDHLDPGTLPLVQAANPGCRFIVPRALRALAIERGLAASRLIEVNAGDRLEPAPGLSVTVLPAAHETLTQDGKGDHLFLGYFLDFNDIAVYHSGDCVPFDGLEELLNGLHPDIMLLPINGRDEYRTSRGIIGNFTLDEALDLTDQVGAQYLIGHHFGLFDFNTIDPEEARQRMRGRATVEGGVRIPAESGVEYRFTTAQFANFDG